MSVDAAIHHRRSIRLRGYDYASAGLYFITICTHNRVPLFGKVVGGEMALNEAGGAAAMEWAATAEMRSAIALDEFVVMPNHVHCIVAVGAHCMRPETQSGVPGRVQRAPTVGDVVRGYKSAVTRRVRQLRNLPSLVVWQRNYYEHIIRDEAAYLEIAQYIQTNPLRWQDDMYHVPE